MVKRGDLIIIDDTILGRITHIVPDKKLGRYLICYKAKDGPHYFIEGDSSFKVVNKKEIE